MTNIDNNIIKFDNFETQTRKSEVYITNIL